MPNTSKSIAVLPFLNHSAEEDLEYFSDGITEEIIHALTKIHDLKVTSRTSAFFFKKKKIPLREIGQQLQVASILEGSVRIAGNRMRISARLIDVAEDLTFWTETFDRELADLFAVQDEISLLIAERLREQLGHFDISTQLAEKPNVPVSAYQQFLRARFLLLKMGAAELEEGIEILSQLLQQYPDFPQAHLGIHLGYTLMGTIGLMPVAEAFPKGQPHLEKAVELAPELPDCQLHLSWLALLQDWNPAAAYQHLQRVEEVRPIVDFYQSMASILVTERKTKAAHHYINTALEMDPFAEINYHLKAFIFYIEKNYEVALEFFNKSIELKANFSISTLYKGQTLLAMGKTEACLDHFLQLPDDTPGDILKQGGLTLAYTALGSPKATEGITQLHALLKTELVERALNLLIFCYFLKNDIEKVLELIEQGIALRLPMMVYLPCDPLLQPLYQNERFSALMYQIIPQPHDTDFSERKYKKALFTTEELDTHKQALLRYMTEEQPYLDPGLTLPILAKQLQLPANHLSQLLNEGFHQNFAAFVNHYRLETFKRKAADPKLKHLTILALAYDSGFNSKTVFNTFFKKKMGMTPSTYCKRL